MTHTKDDIIKKRMILELDSDEFDYIEDALSLLANYRTNEESDAIGSKLTAAWNKGE